MMTCKTKDGMETSGDDRCNQTAQLIAAIEAGNVCAAEQALQIAGTDINAVCGAVRVTALQLAAVRGDDGLELVKLLLRNGAQANVTDKLGRGPLHQAASMGGTEVVQALLAAGARPDIRLQVGSWQCKQTIQNMKLSTGGIECPDVQAGTTLAVPECWGRTPLHQAVKGNYPKCVKLLLDAGASADAQDEGGLTPLLLAGAGVSVSSLHYPLYWPLWLQIHLNFGPLCPTGQEQQMAVVSSLMSGCDAAQQGRLFQHPLLQLFIRMKWRKLRSFFLILMAVQFSFVVTLSTYVAMLVQKEVDEHELKIPQRILIATSLLLLVYAVGQLLLLPQHYIREVETWLHLTSATLAAVVAIMGEVQPDRKIIFPDTNMTNMTTSTGMTPGEMVELRDSILHMSSVCVLLAWAELMLLLSRFPTWGYYALMFQAVLINVLKVLLAFVCLVVGFAFSFSIQFHAQKGFQNPWRALVKTSVMMMGEFQYDDLLEMDAPNTRLPITSRVVFLAFVILAPIVLMNLMVGLAVSDIQALQNEGHIRRLLKQADFVAHLEKLSSHSVLSSDFFPRRMHVALDARRRIPTKLTIKFMQAQIHMPNRLMEELISVALRNQEREQRQHKRSDEDSTSDIISLDGNTTTRCCTSGGIASAAILDALNDLQRQMTDMRRLLQMDRTTVAKSFQTSVKKNRTTRRPQLRFSEAVTGVRDSNGILRNLRRAASQPDA